VNAPRGAILIVVAVAAVLSAALWVPLGEPLRYLRTTLPAGAVLGSIALGAVLFVLRAPLQSGARQLARVPKLGFIVPSLLATLLFALSWAGSHGDRATQVGILPQLVFPAMSGLFAFAVSRYGASIQRVGSPWFGARDHLGPRVRFILLIALTAGVSYALQQVIGRSAPALNEQLLVVVGMLAGYLLLAPRQQASPIPSAAAPRPPATEPVR